MGYSANTDLHLHQVHEFLAVAQRGSIGQLDSLK